MALDPASLKDWRYEVDRESIAWATFDREDASANALGRRPLEELGAIIEEAERAGRAGTIKGLVFISGKQRGYIVGADINEFEKFTSEAEVIAEVGMVNAMLDRLEKLPIPVVAAVHGFCVGGGLELILACHYRIATRDPSTKIGFPEVKLGIFPGFNGTARSIRQAGPMSAMSIMLSGSFLSASAAKGMGLIDELVAGPDSLHWAARKAVLQKRKSKPASFAKAALGKWPARLALAKKMRSEVAKKAREDHYPAPYRLIDLFEKHGGDLEAMKRAEPAAFAPMLMSPQSKSLRRVFKLSEALKAQAPKSLKWKPTHVHVIGAGTMGADIAGVCVAAGMEVTLQDISAEQIEKGIKAQGKLIAKKFKTKATRDAAKARLIADPEGKGIGRADVVIEAIVEKLDIKQKLFADLETKVKPDAVLATNTSSLKLADISQPMTDPSRLVGLHFFSPVAMMPLVEVVQGDQTRTSEVEKGAAFVTAIGKFPLITKDVPGFLVSKVLTPYMFAAMARLEKGEDKEKIDEAVRTFGMPMGPIELADSVGLDICAHVARILGHDPAGSRLDILVNAGKLGKKTGEGFYKWVDGKPQKGKNEWSKADLEKLGRELVDPIIQEAQKSLDEGIVASSDLVDAGMIFGTGFAPFRGGPLYFKSQEETKSAKAAA
ncbi:MAG TPA: 3-hydroxyacyl-CoA dehydrogenase NAD-binding domain-containing protein [Hyphomicrobium sp.]|nr:3-hydroxyacyl-CoA dehydrogenase NAD-binding domain-containing protein [Hyphomicrobium sp.]